MVNKIRLSSNYVKALECVTSPKQKHVLMPVSFWIRVISTLSPVGYLLFGTLLQEWPFLDPVRRDENEIDFDRLEMFRRLWTRLSEGKTNSPHICIWK